jgi:eukaryotic-like serine/threonine-protein kinase
LREQVPGIPPTIEAVVLKALEKDPHRRFTSVQEFATAFEQACQTLLPVTPAMLPNSRIWVGSASHALEESPFYASPTLAESTLQPPESGKRGISRRELLVAAIGVVGLAGTSGGFGLWALSQQRRMGSTLVTYTGHLSQVATVAWSPDGKRIASPSAGPEKNVQIWDVTSGTTIYIYCGHTLGVNDVAWSPDGQYIASASNDGTVRVWQAS